MNQLNDLRNFKIFSLLILIFIIGISTISGVSADLVPVTTNIQDAIDSPGSNNEVQLSQGVVYSGSGNVDLNISKDLTIRGMGTGATINGQNTNRIINRINTGVTLNLINITFMNGAADNYGGAIYNNNQATLNIYDCTFTNNNVNVNWNQARGGAIYNNGNLRIENSNFQNNYANSGNLYGGQGGAIYNTRAASTLTIVNSNFDFNHAYGGSAGSENTDGGAIYINAGTVNIYSSNFTKNTGVKGGAIFNNGELTIANSIFDNNSAYQASQSNAGKGGAIYSIGNMLVTSSVLSNNEAKGSTGWTGNRGQGGAVYVGAGDNRVQYSIIYGNTAYSNANGHDFYNNNGGWLGSYGDFWADNNFWGNNTGWQNRLGGWKTNQLPSSYYIVNILTDEPINKLLIGDDLPYYLTIYKNGTSDKTGSNLLPDLLVRLNSTTQNAKYGPQTENLGNYPAYGFEDETTILGEVTTIDVYFIGTGNKLDTLIYTTADYRPFIKDLTIDYIDDPIYGQKTVIEGTVVDIFNNPMSGDLTITINGLGSIVETNLINGNFNVNLLNTFIGFRNIEVSFVSTAGKSATPVSRGDVIYPATLEINIDQSGGVYGDDGWINGSIEGIAFDDDNVTVVILINGRRYNTTVNGTDNSFSFKVEGIDFLTTSYVITAYGDSNFNYVPAVARDTFNVDKAELNIVLYLNGGIYGDDGTISGRVEGIVFNDFVTIKLEINGETYYLNVSGNGEFSFDIGAIDFLTTPYTVSVEGKVVYISPFFPGLGTRISPDYYMATPAQSIFFVIPRTLTIELDNNNGGVYGQDGTVSGKVVGIVFDDDVTVMLFINGRTYYATVNRTDNTFSFNVEDIDFLTTNYIVTAYGDSYFRYVPAIASDTFNVDKAELNIVLYLNGGVYSEDGTISGRVDGIAFNDIVTIKLEINGETYYLNVSGNGEFSFDIGAIDFLTTPYTVSVEGKVVYRNPFFPRFGTRISPDYYEASPARGIFFVIPKTLTIELDNNGAVYGDNGVITGKVEGFNFNNDDVRVMLIINGQRYYATVNGTDNSFEFDIGLIDFGTTNYMVTVLGKVVTVGSNTFYSPFYYISAPAFDRFNVEPADLSIDITYSRGTYGQNGTINGTINGIKCDNDEIEVTIVLNGKTYTAIVNKTDNTFSFNVEDIDFETTDYTVSLNAISGIYNQLSEDFEFVVDPGDLIVTITSSGGIKGQNGWINGTIGGIVHNDDLILQININGKDYFAKVQSDASFSFNLGAIDFETQDYNITILSTTGHYNLISGNPHTFTVRALLIPPVRDINNTDDEENNNLGGIGDQEEDLESSNLSNANAKMKQTAVPLVAILLVLLSSLGLLVRKR